MAFDRTYDEYHLTPNGWVSGTSKVFSNGPEIEPPAERVETWARHMEQASGWSREHIDWKLIWFDENATEADRKALRRRFRKPLSDFVG